jgi:hypothetical protein
MRRFVFVGLVALLCALTATATALVSPASTHSANPSFFSTTRTFSSSSCPYGWKLTGGGVAELPPNSYYSFASTEYALTGSYPTGFGWRATATVTRGTYTNSSGWRYSTSSYSPRVYVVCAR